MRRHLGRNMGSRFQTTKRKEKLEQMRIKLGKWGQASCRCQRIRAALGVAGLAKSRAGTEAVTRPFQVP